MLLNVSSNIISGAYAVLELLTTVILTRLLTATVGILNIKAIYEERRKILLTTSRLPIVSEHGLSTSRIHLGAGVISIIVLSLTTLGQFAIVGVAKKEYEDVTVKYLVNKAPPDYIFPVQKHASLERPEVSKELLVLRQFLECSKSTRSFIRFYQYIYEGEDIETPKHSPTESVNITCITSDYGFETKVAIEEERRICRDNDAPSCSWKVDVNGMKKKSLTRASFEMSDGCVSKVREGWCYLDYELDCVVLLEYPTWVGLGTFVHSGEISFHQIVKLPHGEVFVTDRLKAAVLLMAAGLASHPSYLLAMTSLRVERNATVRKIVNHSQQATEIHVSLLVIALTSATAILLSIAIFTLYLWIKVVFIPGRQGYNRFNSAADLLSCAAVEKFRNGGCRYRKQGKIIVALDPSGTHAAPIKLTSEESENSLTPSV